MSRPNILIYCTDQQRADLLGCMGHPSIRTPHLDALAARGTLLRQLHIQATVCMPSRASILTGRYPSQHGVMENGFDLPRDATTIAHRLRDVGYFTACVGRTHVTCSQPHPVLPERGYRGFDIGRHSQCYWEGLDPHGAYATWIREHHPELYEKACATPPDRTDAYCASWCEVPQDKCMTAWVTDQTLDLLQQHTDQASDQPFFMWAGVWDPHLRFITPSPWQEMYDPADIPLPTDWQSQGPLPDHLQARFQKSPNPDVSIEVCVRNTLSLYWGMISYIDDQFGRLMRGLEAMGQLDNTVVIFVSDHGEMAGDFGLWGKQGCFYEAVNRVPGIVAGPTITPGQATDALVETIDILPTLLDLADAAADPDLPGRSFAPLLRGQTDHHRDDVFAEHQDLNASGQLMAMLRTTQHKLVHLPDQPAGLLFDLKADPHETQNLWQSHPDLRTSMQTRLLNRLMTHTARADTRHAKW